MRWYSLFLSHAANWSAQPLRIRIIQAIAACIAAAGAVTALVIAYALLIVAPTLPPLDTLTDYRPKIPLRIFTADNVLIGEFGEERRSFVPITQVPPMMKKALLAIEDDRFYEHGGVNYKGVLRALLSNLRGGHTQGASTITMQVARNFFLTRDKTYARKINEVMLSYKIEAAMPKDKILELYMNQIYLGERAYGFAAAARTYFGKPIQDVTIAEAAMLAGLPKAPSTGNPAVNPKRATLRQQLVLKRMRELGYITPAQYAQAGKETVKVLSAGQRFPTHAEYAVEIVRQQMAAQYKDDVYTRGYTVYTTLLKADQDAAYAAVRRGVMDYERRHGYRGPEDFIDLPADEDERDDVIDEALLKHPSSDDLLSAVILSATPKLVRAEILSGEVIEINGEGLRFAAAGLSAKAAPELKLRAGALIRVTQDARKKWSITQLPEVSAAFVSLNAQDGSYRALVGGFDFALNQFDHVSQAWRQPGSSIKPFIYSAALEKGFSPATLINDAPLTVDGAGGQSWEPQNDEGTYDGPVTMRTGLKKSKNLVSIRLLRAITPAYAQDYITRFGFDAAKHPANLTMALGTGSVTPLQMASAYSVFANGGYQFAPTLIRKVLDPQGKVLSESAPPIKDDKTSRVLDPRNAFIMDSMLHDVVRSGTAFAASQALGRGDLAGKTGTTSDAVDGWFAGYSGDVVAVAWMGYDKPKTLGNREFGSTLALPIWINYMREALRGRPQYQMPVPEFGLLQADGDWMYAEYADKGGVKSLGIEESSSFWDRLFGPSPTQPTAQDPEAKRAAELYRGGGH